MPKRRDLNTRRFNVFRLLLIFLKGAAGPGFHCALRRRAVTRLEPGSSLRGSGLEYPEDLR